MAAIRKRTWIYCTEHGSAKACREHGCGAGRKRTAYEFTIVHDGKRTRKQFPSRAEALGELDKFRERLKQPKVTVPTLTLGDALTRYLATLSTRGNPRSREDRRIAEHLRTAFGAQTSLVEVTANRISEYKAARLAVRTVGTGENAVEVRLTAAAVNRPLALLRHLLRLAHEEWEVLPAVPKLRTEREPQGRLRWLTEGEAICLLEACRKSQNKALADLVEFSLFTGLRRGETLGLTWDRVDRPRGVVRLDLTKSGHRREVPLSSNADAVMARRWSDGAAGFVFGSRNWATFQSAWEVALTRAKVDGFRFHDLRHTFASWLVQRGRPLREVQELLGHKTIAMTMRYAHLAPEHLRSAVAVLDGALPARDGARVAQENEADCGTNLPTGEIEATSRS